ncbi:MAG: hypothetical protein WD766_05755 [Gemmatimonadota bacterium]
MNRARYTGNDGAFELRLPAGWKMEPDAEGGALVSAVEGRGLLHLVPFERELEEPSDPAEELYAFLEDQEIELQEDEVDDLELPGEAGAALCEYLAEEGDELVYWLVCVATAPSRLLFASYSCPSGQEDDEREVILQILSTLTFDDLPAGP